MGKPGSASTALWNVLRAAADRSSRYYRWEARLTPEEVTRKVARYGSVGEVRDMDVERFGD